MRLLVDSHVLLWLLYEPERIGPDAIRAIEQSESVAVSVASLWELTLKHRAGKLLPAPTELAEGIDALALDELPLLRRHVVAMRDVVLPHGDPFDAVLIAQAQSEARTFVTADRMLIASRYEAIDVRR
ncbi:MAG: PIN domain nuclease [Microbacterium sp.]|nr:MAG: PIN domain nuclease [Microbacterium sp.]